jgi:hypothetical protein
MAKYEKIAEVEAFMEKFNYFRKPYNERDPTDTTWIRKHGFAGDRIVQDALDGKGDIGLLLNKRTAFICFDIDPKKEEEDAGSGEPEENVGDGDHGETASDGASSGEAEDGDTREDLLRADKTDGGSASAEDEGKSTVEPRNADRGVDGREGVKGPEGDNDNEGSQDRQSGVGDPAKDWPGWKELGIDENEKWRARWAAIAAMPKPPIVRTRVRLEFRRELGPELRAAVEMLLECFNEGPSLVVKSPHGAHVYWCLETEEPSFKVRPVMVKVRREWLREARERGIEDIGIEILPSTRKPLRVPRKDRLIEPGSLEPMEKPEDGEAFWRSLKRYPFEGLIKEEVLNRKAGNAKRPGPQKPKKESGERSDTKTGSAELEAVERVKSGQQAADEAGGVGAAGGTVGTGSAGAGAGENASDGAAEAGEDNTEEMDILSLRPKNRNEAERMLMPFRNRETNPQLIKMIEGAKREGLSLEEVTVWILSWEGRSREAGYRGELFYNRELLKDRIAALYATSTATAAGASRFIELWNSRNMGYVRNDKAAERAIGELDRITLQPKQSRKAVRRFMADIEAWKRIIDDAAADPTSGLDKTTKRNRAKGVYPLPYALLRVMYSGSDRVWKDMLAAGIVVKAEGNGGQYVPNIGRPQYYHLNI